MDRHLIAAKLDELFSEGEKLESEGPAEPGSVRAWYATVIATLGFFLPENSELVGEFKGVRDGHLKDREGDKLPKEALSLLRSAIELNRLRRSGDVLEDLRYDVRVIVSDMEFKLFVFPLTILFAAAGFAVVGVIQLHNIKINVREVADAALRDAKTSIEEHRTSVETHIREIGKEADSKVDEAKHDVQTKLEHDLQSYLDEARNQINAGAQRHLETIKQEKTPDLERGLITAQTQITELEKRVQEVQARVATLQSSSEELEGALKTIDAAAGAGTLERASLFLHRSRQWIWGELIISTIAVLVLVIAAIKSVWHRIRHGHRA